MSENFLQPLNQLKTSTIKYVFTDIDDTLTRNGLLEKESYNALWLLSAAGIKVVPVTGRPAGWCELIARQWPVDGVIGENGGLYFRYHSSQMKRFFWQDEKTREANRKTLNLVWDEIHRTIPRATQASDQFSRLLDLAIDICEDIKPPLSKQEIQTICRIFESHGAHTKLSSIHINGWVGAFDKKTMCCEFLKKEHGLDPEQSMAQLLFVGDSPNDEPLFAFFNNSVGVANVKDFSEHIKKWPKFVTTQDRGRGFAELAQVLLAK